jgi:hypothetical protein
MLRLARRCVPPLVALLCVAVAVLWWRSRGDADVLIAAGPRVKLSAAASYHGRLVFFASDIPSDPGGGWAVHAVRAPAEQLELLYEGAFEQGSTLRASLAGFQLGHGRISVFKTTPAFTAVTVPHWFVVVLTALPTVLWLRAIERRWRWGRQGRCRACGYDLRSSPDRCPECGEARKPKRLRTRAVAAAAFLAALAPGLARAAEDVAARRIAELDLSRTTLEDAFEVLRDKTHANIVVHWPALEDAGIERATPIRLRLWDVGLGAALNILLDSAEPVVPLAWSEDDGVITVSTEEDVHQTGIMTVYDVRDLLDAIRPAPVPGGAPPSETARTRGEAIDELTRLITECVDPETWRDAGGTTGSMRELGARLIITQSRENHKKIHDLLKQLRAEFARPMPVPTTRPAATAPTDGQVLGGDSVRFYDVRDILKAIADADALHGAKPRTSFEVEAQLVGVVIENVGRDHWETVSHGINFVAGRLVVNQSPEVHEKLKEFLAKVRRELFSLAAATSPSAPTPPARPPAGGRSGSSRASPSAARPPAR